MFAGRLESPVTREGSHFTGLHGQDGAAWQLDAPARNRAMTSPSVSTYAIVLAKGSSVLGVLTREEAP